MCVLATGGSKHGLASQPLWHRTGWLNFINSLSCRRGKSTRLEHLGCHLGCVWFVKSPYASWGVSWIHPIIFCGINLFLVYILIISLWGSNVSTHYISWINFKKVRNEKKITTSFLKLNTPLLFHLVSRSIDQKSGRMLLLRRRRSPSSRCRVRQTVVSKDGKKALMA
jgi:hypothetical protein